MPSPYQPLPIDTPPPYSLLHLGVCHRFLAESFEDSERPPPLETLPPSSQAMKPLRVTFPSPLLPTLPSPNDLIRQKQTNKHCELAL